MYKLVPTGSDWVGDSQFQQQFTEELAREIEEAVHQRVQLINPKSDPKKLVEAFKVRINGKGSIEVHKMNPERDFLAGALQPRAQIKKDGPRLSRIVMPDEDPVKAGIRDAMQRIPTVLDRTRKVIGEKTSGSMSVDPPLDEFFS